MADAFRGIRRQLEEKVNAQLAGKAYGPVERFSLIAILREEDSSDYGEVKKYQKRDKVLELRLKMDHRSFKEADERERMRQYMACILRGAELTREMDIPGLQSERLIADLYELAARESLA